MALARAGFEQDELGEYVRLWRTRSLRRGAAMETRIWLERDRYVVSVWSDALPAVGDEPMMYGTTTLVKAEDGSALVVETVHRAVAVPKSVVGSLRRAEAVARALVRGERVEPGVPADELEARANALIGHTAARIQEGVVQINHVFARAGVGLTYTVGLQHLYDQPELVVMGLPATTGARLIEALGQRVAAGEAFLDGDILDDVMNLPVAVVGVPGEVAAHVLASATRFYEMRGRVPEAHQVVWPDSAGRFPPERGYALNGDVQDLTTTLDDGVVDRHAPEVLRYRVRVRPT
ncbi:MAG: DUF4262 domain-containing protein [Rubricoccaceae bacterium]|nr:DUF4262 domain-containing protein [Rubricoccaceae bacterium]